MSSDERLHFVGVFEHLGERETLVHLVKLLEQVEHRLHPLLHHFFHGFLGVEFRFLFEVSYRIARREYHFALERLVNAGDNFQQRGFTRAVKTDNADFRAVEEREVDVLEHLFLGRVNLVYPHHREYYLFVVSHNGNLSFWLSDAAGAISAVHLAVNNIVEF